LKTAVPSMQVQNRFADKFGCGVETHLAGR